MSSSLKSRAALVTTGLLVLLLAVKAAVAQQVDPNILDFGDAPNSYLVRLVDNGPRHQIGSHRLGNLIDGEIDGQPSALAQADGVDEDGVVFGPIYYSSLIPQANSFSVSVNAAGVINAFIDFNRNGIWDLPAEAVTAAVPAAGHHVIPFVAPINASNGITYARIRFSEAGGLGPAGLATSGEVEDYVSRVCEMKPPTCCTHVMFVIDTSGSMINSIGVVQAALDAYVKWLKTSPSQIGIVTAQLSLGGVPQSNLLQPLTGDKVTLQNAIANIAPVLGTNEAMDAGITLAQGHLAVNQQGNCTDAIIIISDGYRVSRKPETLAAALAAQGVATVVSMMPGPRAQADEDYMQSLATPGFFYIGLMQGLFDASYALCDEEPPSPACLPPGGEGATAELGDAPDSTNHFGSQMSAYPSALASASYPTVFDPATGAVPGPRHLSPLSDIILGQSVTREEDADQLPDDDYVTNISPELNRADQDGGDEGVGFPIGLPLCATTSFTYTVTVALPSQTRYANTWIDFNQDGDWADTLTCMDGGGVQRTVPEWVVQDQAISLATGVHVVHAPTFWANPTGSQVWMRMTVSAAQAPAPGDGRGPVAGYTVGETEDYLLGKTPEGTFAPGGE